MAVAHTLRNLENSCFTQAICGIPAIYVQWIQTEILILASFNWVLLCTWHAFTPQPPICSLHLHCSIFNSKISELPGPLRCLLLCGLLVWLLLTMRKEFKCSKQCSFPVSPVLFEKSSCLACYSFSSSWNLGHKEQSVAFTTWKQNAIALHSYIFSFCTVAEWVQGVVPSLSQTNPLLSVLSYWTVWKRAIPLSSDSFW